jgi:hypothetical protein
MAAPVPSRSADEVARELADRLEARGIDYAIGGALAYNQWSVPRTTDDVDLNLWLDPADPTGAAHTVGSLGCQFRASAMIREFTESGWAYAFLHGVHVDFYLPTQDFHASMRIRRRRKLLLEREAWFLSAEDLAVCKLVIFRTQDLADLERLLLIQGRALDRNYVRDWITRLAGAQDLRVKRWDELVEAAEPAIRLREEGWKPPHLRE